jgi:hypothetical protein
MEQIRVKMASLAMYLDHDLLKTSIVEVTRDGSSRTRLLTCPALHAVEGPCVTVHVAVPSDPLRLDRLGHELKPHQYEKYNYRSSKLITRLHL